MVNAVEGLLRARGLIPPGSFVLCAVSGGADSVCLLHILYRLREKVPFTLAAAHYNHRLRGEESERDAAFTEEFILRYCPGVPLHTGSGDVRGESARRGTGLEETAREMRYAFLRETAKKIGADRIATAHNADDSAETVLLNLVRGAGLKGLSGIPFIQGEVVRPLLASSRAEITAYLQENGLPHVEDSSNSDEAFARNKLRRQVMPLLRELNPRAVEHINAAAAQAYEADRYLDQESRRALTGLDAGPNWVSLPWDRLRKAPPPLRPRLLLLLLDRLQVGRKDFGTAHLEAALQLKKGRCVDLPHGVTARREGGKLLLARRQALPGQAVLERRKPLAWGGYTLTLLDKPEGAGFTLSVPAGTVLTVGPCPPARRLTLPGSDGARTVKRLCLDQRIGLAERDGLPAVYADGRLAAVWPLGVDTAFAPQGGNGCFIQVTDTGKDEQT